ncbi:hypothetical protein ABVT39_002045 [Epinephelus coioides]
MYEVSDLALWGEVSENARGVLIDRGPAAYHNCTSRYPESTRDGGLGGKVRSFTNDLLYSLLQNGEKVSRDWITYSASTASHWIRHACRTPDVAVCSVCRKKERIGSKLVEFDINCKASVAVITDNTLELCECHMHEITDKEK